MKKNIILTVILAIVVSSLTTFLITNSSIEKSKGELIKEFYEVENAVHVSPHGLRKKMSKGETKEYILVDLRSQEEYEKEHIISAINIPAYSDPNHSAYDDTERILSSFEELDRNKDIIVYCYSTPCMTGRKIGKLLAKNGIFVKHLGIGWNEWRYYWDLWNHDGEIQVDPKNYIMSGSEPGIPQIEESLVPLCGDGEFDC